MVDHIAVDTCRGKDGGPARGAAARRVACALKGGPRGLEESAVLRVHQLRLVRHQAPERGVEILRPLDQVCRRHIAGVRPDLTSHALGRELRRAPEGQGVGARLQQGPQLFGGGRARESAGHADQRKVGSAGGHCGRREWQRDGALRRRRRESSGERAYRGGTKQVEHGHLAPAERGRAEPSVERGHQLGGEQ